MTAFSSLTRHFRRQKPARGRSVRELESLERRCLLSAAPDGNEFLVNNYITRVQESSPHSDSAAYQPGGSFIITFAGSSGDNSLTPQDPVGIYARMYNVNGVSQGVEFQVNTFTDGDQATPSIATAADGSFVIVWSGPGRDEATQARDQHGVFGQRFSVDGARIGGQFLINETVQGSQEDPTLSMAPDGRFVVSWSGVGRLDGNSNLVDVEGVFFRQYAADGTPVGQETNAHTMSDNTQAFASTALDASGDFVVTWSSLFQDGEGWGVFAQRFAADGTRQGSEFRINDVNSDDQRDSRVGMADDGRFVITWSSRRGGDNSDWGVYQRSYAADGTALSQDTLVNQFTSGDQRYSKIAMTGDGKYVISWDSAAQDTSGWSVVAREYNVDTTADGDEFLLNTVTVASQQHSTVAFSESGLMLLVWEGEGGVDRDGVFARRYRFNQDTILSPIPNQSVVEGNLVTFTATATDPDLPAQSIRFSVDSPAPAGAAIDPITGVFTWTPAEADGPGRFFITVRASDTVNPAGSSIQIVTIDVTEINQNPVVNQIPAGFDVDAGSGIQFAVAATDPDLPPNTLTWALSTPTQGATINAQTGFFDWQTTAAQGGRTFTFTVVVTDGQGGVGTSTFDIRVNSTNQAPVLAPIGARTINEGSNLTFTVSATDSDLPAQTLTFAATGLPTGATFNPATRVFAWTPTEAQGPGTFSVIFTVTDSGTGMLMDTETVVITVSEVNQAPTIEQLNNQTVNEGQIVAFNVSVFDADLPSQSLTRSVTGLPTGATFDPANGNFSWQTGEADQGVFTLTFTVSDNQTPALTASRTVTITVVEVNSAPAIAPITDPTVLEGQALSFTVVATDPDLPAQQVTLSATGLPPGATFDPLTGIFNFTPDETQGGSNFIVMFTATDNANPALSSSINVTITVQEANQDPILTSISDVLLNESQLLSFTVIGVDLDQPAQTLVYSLQGTVPAGAAIDPTTGLFTWTPTEAQGPGDFPITVRVTDSLGGFDEQVFTVMVQEVNLAPNLAAIPDATLDEGTLLTFTATATDPDLPANLLTFSLDNTAPAGATIDPVTGVFTWTPSAAQAGQTFTIIVLVTDNGLPALADSETFQVTVVDVNSPPAIAAVPDQTVDEGGIVSFTATAVDPEGNNFTWSLGVGAPAAASINPTTGAFTWTTVEADGPGTFTITIRATDDGNPAAVGSRVVNVTVNELNQAPFFFSTMDRLTTEDLPFTLQLQATDLDLPTQSLVFSLVSGPSNVAVAPGGLLSFTPNENDGGQSYPVTVRVTDSLGASADVTIMIMVDETNQAPVLAPIGNRAGTINTLLSFTVSATDGDIPVQTIVLSATGLPTGATFDPGTGLFSWTPDGTQIGVVSVTFAVSDGAGGMDSEIVDLTIGVNAAPSLQTITDQTGTEGTLLSVTAMGTDPNVGDVLTYSLGGTVPVGATIDPATGVISWTPAEDQGGQSFTITVVVTDNGTPALSGMTTFMVTVAEANQPPVLGNIADQTASEGQLLTFTITATDADLPAQTLAFNLLAPPAGASIDPNTGVFSFTPDESQGGTSVSITVVVTDGVVTDMQTFSVTVAEANNPPVIPTIADMSVDELDLLQFTITATDPEGQTITYSLQNAPFGAMISSTTGAFSFAADESQGGDILPVTVVATDSGGMFASRTFNVTVNIVNQQPAVAAISNQTIMEGVQLSIQTIVFDIDDEIGWNNFTYELTGPTAASVSGSGLITWTPSEADGPGDFPFSITVRDSGIPIMSRTRLFTVTVLEVNQTPVIPSIATQSIGEGQLLTLTVNATDADVPAQALVYSLGGTPPTGATINPSTGAFSWTPDNTTGGSSFPITVNVTDGVANASITFTVNVVEGNLPPVISAILNQSLLESTILQFTVMATDPEGGTVTFSLGAGAPPALDLDPVTGELRWSTTEVDGPGVYPVTVIATDDGTPSAMATRTFTITVNEDNEAPVFTDIPDQTATELLLLTFTVVANDLDLPVQTITYALDNVIPAGATLNPTSGVFTWTPAIGQAGNYNLTVRATDSLGASTTTIVSITVAPPGPPGNPETSTEIGDGSGFIPTPGTVNIWKPAANTVIVGLTEDIEDGLPVDPRLFDSQIVAQDPFKLYLGALRGLGDEAGIDAAWEDYYFPDGLLTDSTGEELPISSLLDGWYEDLTPSDWAFDE